MSDEAALTAEEALARAKALTPRLRERSAAADALRRIPDETMRDLVESGLFRLLQPVRYGGVEQDLETFLRTVLELARGCGSAGWVYSVTSIHQWLLGMFPDAAQRDVWGADHNALAASSIAPGGKVTRETDGFRLSGSWGFCSGCDNVQWIILAGFLGMVGEKPRPDLRLFLVPMSDCAIEDNWHVLGLRGTGSKNVVLDGVFVPEHRAVDYFAVREGRSPGREVNRGPLYALPAWANFPLCLAAPSVGIAAGALERFVVHLATRTGRVAGKKIGEYATLQMRIAEASAMIDAAELLLLRDVRDAMDAVAAGGGMDLAQRMRNRRDHGFAVRQATQAVELLFRACGGTGLFDDFEIQRGFRDVNATAAHIGTNWDAVGTMFGAFTVGLTPTELFY